MKITPNGSPYLGAGIGSNELARQDIESNIQLLSDITNSQPPIASSAMTHGLQSKWISLSHTVPNIVHLLEPLVDALRSELLSAITPEGHPKGTWNVPFCSLRTTVGLGISIPSRKADRELQSSILVIVSLPHSITR